MPLRCFIQAQAPVPNSSAAVVHYPVCEWVGDDGTVDLQHPLNRFVCSWLTSDVRTVERCQDVREALHRIASGQSAPWFADGDAFQVDCDAQGAQFNFSHVGPSDVGWWNLPEGRFAVSTMNELVQQWQDALVRFSIS